MPVMEKEKIRTTVRERYAKISKESEGCGCDSHSCCSTAFSEESLKLGYSDKDLKSVPQGANLGLGCGNPQAIARLKRGETVIDLGSGGGFDCFLAAKKVGGKGKVIGVDMTPEMITRARENSVKGKYRNVEFRLGEIEHLPVGDNTADVIISNCVINLSPDKKQVYKEAYRVLKSGGRLAISDVVAIRPIPERVRKDAAKLSGCVSGALPLKKLNGILNEIGFEEIGIHIKVESREFIREWFPGSGIENFVRSAEISGTKKNGRKKS